MIAAQECNNNKKGTKAVQHNDKARSLSARTIHQKDTRRRKIDESNKVLPLERETAKQQACHWHKDAVDTVGRHFSVVATLSGAVPPPLALFQQIQRLPLVQNHFVRLVVVSFAAVICRAHCRHRPNAIVTIVNLFVLLSMRCCACCCSVADCRQTLL